MRSRATALPGTAVRPMTSRRAGSDFYRLASRCPKYHRPSSSRRAPHRISSWTFSNRRERSPIGEAAQIVVS